MNPPDATAAVLQGLLLYGVVPVWLLAGLGDWLCHRVQRIESSTGTTESLMHLAMLAELGVGLGAVLLLQVDALVLAVLLACCVAHELTMWWDLAYATARRRIPWPEQWVHGVQMAVPWAATLTLAVIHRDQALALAGLGDVAADWSLRWKTPGLPGEAIAAVVAGGAVVVAGFVQEWWRCVRAARGTTASASAGAMAPRRAHDG